MSGSHCWSLHEQICQSECSGWSNRIWSLSWPLLHVSLFHFCWSTWNWGSNWTEQSICVNGTWHRCWYFSSISRAYPLSIAPQSCMLTLVTPFMFLASSMSVPDTSLSLRSFPSLLLLVLDPHFWEEIGSLKFIWIGTKSSAYMLLSLQFCPLSLYSCMLSFKTTPIYSRMNSELLKDCLPNLNWKREFHQNSSEPELCLMHSSKQLKMNTIALSEMV